jgi:uracil-DNA glycosylase
MQKKKEKLIFENNHLVLKTGHPSPLSANRGYWFGNKHFSKCNKYLESFERNKIDWSL